MSWNIIAVDDDRACLCLIAIALERHGHTVHKFNNASSALKYLAICNERIDLIVSDIVMPCICGFEFLEALKSDSRVKHIPLIFQTADSNVTKKCFTLGVKGCLIKPYRPQDLLKLVDSILMQHNSILKPIENVGWYDRHTARQLSA